MHRLILTGALAGKTINLRGVQYTDGVAVLHGTLEGIKGIVRYHGRSWQAYLEGSEELKKAQARYAASIPTKTQPRSAARVQRESGAVEQPAPEAPARPGSGDAPSDGDGGGHQADSGDGLPAEQVAAIKAALQTLDPTKDEDWTRGGRPSIQAVTDRLGFAVTRSDITEAAPEFRRPE